MKLPYVLMLSGMFSGGAAMIYFLAIGYRDPNLFLGMGIGAILLAVFGLGTGLAVEKYTA
jgi:hypothetical protein